VNPTHPLAAIEGLFKPGDPQDFYTVPFDALEMAIEPNGIVGARRHSGSATLADVRAPAYTRKVDVVLNRQSISLVGAEDMDYIADELDLNPYALFVAEGIRSGNTPTATFNRMMDDLYERGEPRRITRRFLARCLGANVLLGSFTASERVPNFRSLAPGTDFGPYDVEAKKFTAATVMITRPNGPCVAPSEKIKQHYPDEIPQLGKRFVQAAQGRRGFVGMVAKGGYMVMDQVVGFVPFGER